ncbi:NUDIX hydrolase [Streptomyces noboritoensis]|uniref:NUDIX hydrolase n=1 Tax=Streptomyces noboritoensis TaxID=67337 RepID=A0ABV6TFX3_9ACTN
MTRSECWPSTRGASPPSSRTTTCTGRSRQTCPAGLIDEGEQPVEAARRELTEETGLRAGWLHALGTVVGARATSTERVHLFLAHACTPGPPALEAGEDLMLQWATWQHLTALDLDAGTSWAVADAPPLAALHRAGALWQAIAGQQPVAVALVEAAAVAVPVCALRDPLANVQATLAWLDVLAGRFPQATPILADLTREASGPHADAAFQHAAQRFAALGDDRAPA